VTIDIHHGDCREVMATLDAEGVDAIVSDPPYGLSFMGKGWDHGVPGVEFWTEALRVAKPGAHLLAFGGTRTYHRLACAIEDAGWEIRDCVMWVYGSGFPKSHDVSKAIDKAAGHWRGRAGAIASDNGGMSGGNYERTPKGDAITAAAAAAWQGWGTALKPAWEPIIVARKPLVGTVAENVLTHGTGAINVDGCRVGGEPSPSASMRASGRVPSSCKPGEYGDTIQNRITPERWQEARPGEQLGRWPANLIHDGSEEVVGLFPQTTSGSRKAGRHLVAGGQDHDHRVLGGNHHPTVKPTDLMRYLCRLVTPPGGVVLDPFTGSGSTGKAAILEGFRFIGIEREAEYVEIAKARIAAAVQKAEAVA